MFEFPTGLSLGLPSQYDDNPTSTLRILAPSMLTGGSGFWYNWGGDEDFQKAYGEIPGWLAMMYKSPKGIRGVDRSAFDHIWMLLNEPDRKGQADLTPWQGVRNIKAALSMGVRRWMGPNICIAPDGYGLAWFKKYIELGGPVPEAWAIHIYPESGQELTPYGWDLMISGFASLAGKLGVAKQIIVTETSAGTADAAGQIATLDHCALRMTTHSWIQAINWFPSYYQNSSGVPSASNLLHSGGGKRNDIGRRFTELYEGSQR